MPSHVAKSLPGEMVGCCSWGGLCFGDELVPLAFPYAFQAGCFCVAVMGLYAVAIVLHRINHPHGFFSDRYL